MQLPVDVKALMDEATNIDEARATSLAVSVFVDETAPADLVACVRGAFGSTSPQVRMALSYCTDAAGPAVHPTDDMAVVVAGASESVGRWAAAIRAAGVPVMVATSMPRIVEGLARAEGCPIPDGDLVSFAVEGGGLEQEPYAVDDARAEALRARMGRWVVAACREKRLAFAVAFPFVRKPLATDAVQATALQNAGIGLVPFIPGADLPLMTLNQGKMALQIAAAYGQSMDKERIRELAAVVAGAFACRTLVRELLEFVPVLGFLVRPGVGYAGTAAMGYAIIEYYEGGRNITGVANVLEKAIGAGTQLVSGVRSRVKG